MAQDGAYFVGRNELLAWINSTLDLNLTKIEQTANGAVACQLMDVLYLNHFPMQKIDYNANNEYIMINNYKVLQNFLNKKGIEKTIEVNKLIKGRPLDNMEFIQWLKAFWDRETGGMELDDDYDARERRQICKTGDIKESGIAQKASSGTVKRPGATKMPTTQGRPSSKGGVAARRNNTVRGPSPVTRSSRTHTPKSYKSKEETVRGDRQAEERIKDLTEQLTDMRMTAEESVREREFYYGKLREIEILCQTPTICDEPIIKIIEQILYAPNEEEARAIVQKCQMDYAGSIFAEGDELPQTIEEDENGNP